MVSCAEPVTLDDLCPQPVTLPDNAANIHNILCTSENPWADDSDEKAFCNWMEEVMLQQEELKAFHEYREAMP